MLTQERSRQFAIYLLILSSLLVTFSYLGIVFGEFLPPLLFAYSSMATASLIIAQICLAAVVFASFDMSLGRRFIFFIVSTGAISLSLWVAFQLAAMLSRSPFRPTPDFSEAIVQIPIAIISLAFAPTLIRIHRGTCIAKEGLPRRTPNRKSAEFGCYAALFLIAVLAFEFAFQPSATALRRSVAAGTIAILIPHGTLLYWPFFSVLMKSSWRTFNLFSSILFCSLGCVSAIFIMVSSRFTLRVDEITYITLSILSGPLLFLMALLSMRLFGFRLIMAQRSMTNDLVSTDNVHPLERDDY